MKDMLPLTQLFTRRRLGLAVLVGLLCAAGAFVVIVTTTPRSLARMDFLIVQNTKTSDFYALFKSSEFLSEILVDAVHTERFIERVMMTPGGKVLHLPADTKKRLTAWRKMVDVSQRHKLGRLEIIVYGDRAHDVRMIANGIADVLIQQNSAFRGGAQNDVEVRLLTGPVIESNPSVQSIIVTLLMSFFFGVGAVFAGAYVRMSRAALARPLHAPTGTVVSFDDTQRPSQTALEWEESFQTIAQKLQRLTKDADGAAGRTSQEK